MTKVKVKPESDLSHIAEGLRTLAIPIGELVSDPANARTHSEKNISAIRGSLAQFGQRKPLIVQQQGMIVRAGNGTLQAAISLGWTHVAAIVVDEDNASAISFAIADNRTAELAEWDTDVLEKMLQEVEVGDEELQEMFASLAESVGIVPPNFEPVGIETQGKLDEKAKAKCPECGHEW